MPPASSPEYRIVSIGTLAAHPLWDEKQPVRTGHATTVLIASGAARILVDPSLPAQILLARMSERTKLKPAEVTHVFLTSFEPEKRRALPAFDHATWLIHEPERQAAMAALQAARQEADDANDSEMARMNEQEIAMLSRCDIADDSIAPKVDLFPLPGVTAGTCGLLIALPGSTVLVCGDAIATYEHLSQGKVLPWCVNIAQAQESFKEAIEIGDVLVPGRDNVMFNPLRRM